MNKYQFHNACDTRLRKLVNENLNLWAEVHMKKSGEELMVTKIPCHSMENFDRDDWRIKAGPDYLVNPNPKEEDDTKFTWYQMVDYLSTYDLSTNHKIKPASLVHKPQPKVEEEEHDDIYWSNKFADYEREQEAKAFLSDPDYRRSL